MAEETAQPVAQDEAPAPKKSKVFRLRLLRGVRIRGESFRAGSVVDVSSVFAGKLVQSNKAELARPGTELRRAPNEDREERTRRYEASALAGEIPGGEKRPGGQKTGDAPGPAGGKGSSESDGGKGSEGGKSAGK